MSHVAGVYGRTSAALAANGLVVDRHGHGGRAGVLTALQGLPGSGDPRLGDGVLIGALPDAHLGLDLDELLPFQRLQDLVRHSGKRQGHGIGDLEPGQVAAEVQDLEGQVLYPELRQAGVVDAADGRRDVAKAAGRGHVRGANDTRRRAWESHAGPPDLMGRPPALPGCGRTGQVDGGIIYSGRRGRKRQVVMLTSRLYNRSYAPSNSHASL